MVGSNFAHTDYWKVNKLNATPVGAVYLVEVLLLNCRVIQYGCQVSHFFDTNELLATLTIEEYLSHGDGIVWRV